MGNAKVTFNNNTLIDLTDATATADHILSGQTAYGATGDKLTGTIDTKTQSNLTASGATVTVPAGYYASQATKSVANGTVTAPSTISGTSASVSTGTNTLTLSKTVSVTPVVSTAGYVSSGTAGNASVSLTASVNTRSSSDLSASGNTVTVPSGYYASSASKAVASGTAGTPTATKGTVSNHSISVTPSVTNTTGYITGSTKTGTAVTVSASELVSGSQTIIENDTYDVTNLASVVVNVEGEPGQARIVDTPDAGGGTVRTITTGEETSLTTKTVTPNDYTQVVISNTKICEGISTTTFTNVSGSGFSSYNGYFSPSTTLTNDQTYRITGSIKVKNNTGQILDSYNINTTFQWKSTAQEIATKSDANSYFKNVTISKYSTNKYQLIYNQQQAGTYKAIAYINIHEEPSLYDGFSSVTVDPNFYEIDLIKKYIERSSSFTTFNFPDGITTIGAYAFASCAQLYLTSLPSSITSIKDYAFDNCYAIALTSLPSGITTIGNYAFRSCTNLALTSLPSGLTTIGSYAFQNCTNLALTSLPSGITSIPSYCFYSCTNLALTSLPSGLTTINNYAFQGCTSLALTSLPSGLRSLTSAVFSGCTSLALTTLPSSVTEIQGSAFRNCTNLTTISCDGVITTLASYVFWGDSTNAMQLTSARFPNLAITSQLSTTFGSTTAANACQLLELVDLGNATGISTSAFANCYSLQTLILRKTTVASLASTNAFTNTPMNGYNSLTGTVYVPSDLIASYKTATNWSTLYNNGTITFQAIEGSNYELD